MAKASCPLLVMVLAVLYLVSGVIVLAASLLTVLGISLLGDPVAGGVVGGAGVLVALISIVVGIGFLKGWSVMWYLGVIFTVISLLGSVVTIITGNVVSVVGVLFQIVVLYYLFRDNVKRYFLG
ncbi:MAG: hypothetical protein IJ026_00200 [Candidatus Methanomethylophilaceae archaeon]|nr:hypothetical protein [Candidatus Methanomethylophilaceae archaeon]